MLKTKEQYINSFRTAAEQVLPEAQCKTQNNDKSNIINKCIKTHLNELLETAKQASRNNNWNNEELLNEILLITYASYIVMLEYRNKVWPYEYMAFARRIGELWEPFCKLPFEYPINNLSLIAPPQFEDVQTDMRRSVNNYIRALNISDSEKRQLAYYYDIPWSLVDSGGIKLGLDLHFEQNQVHYNCDFKSGFSSNEKGNTNRLLLVGSIYHSLGNNEKTFLFVRQEEDQNNHYLQTLKNSPYWECFCADRCYEKMAEYTGFSLRDWLDDNVDWENDISNEFRTHLVQNNLIGYLTW